MKPLHKNHPREEEHRRHLSEGEHQRHPREEEHRSHPGGGEQPSHRVLLSTTPTNRTMTKRGREEDVLLRRDQGDHCEELGRREARGCRRSPSRDARPSHRGQEHKGSTHQEHRAPVVGSERPSSDKERTGRYHSATYHVHRQEQRALATEAIRTSPERERIGKPNAATYRRSYAEATKGAIEASDRGDGRRLDRPSDRVTPIKKTDDEGEWILVKPKRVRREEKKAEKAASSTSSATSVAKKNALCHKCAERGHTIHECTNDWFCYVCKRYGHISKSCPRSVKSGSAQSKASAEVPFVGGCSKPVKAESEESRDGRRMVIREVISPTPIMGEFERRLTNSILLKVHTGFPSIEAIKELLSDSVRPTSRLEWDVKKLKEDTLMVSCKTDEITRELLAIGSLEGEDFYITMSRWSRAFGALKVDAKASLWIRLFNIPLQCWVRSGFQNLIHSFGSLVSIDKNTTFLLRCEYARIQVAVDDVSLIPSVIVAQFEEEKYEIKVIVERKKKVSFRSAPEYSGSNSDVGCKQRDKEEDEHHPSDQTWRNLSHRFGAQDPVRESALIRDQIEYTEQHIPTGPSANLSIGCREEGRVAGVSPRQRPVVGSAIDATGEAGSAVGDSSIRTAGSLRRVLDEEEATDAGRSLRPAVFSQKDNRALDLHKKQPQKLDGAVFSSEVVGQKQPQKLHQSDGGGAGFEGRKFELGQASCGPTKSEAELMGLNSAQFKQALDLAVKTITLSLLQSGPGQWAKQDLRSEAENPVSTTPTQALTAIPSEAAQLTSGRSVGEEFGEQNDPVPVDIGGPVTGEIKQGLMEDSTTMDGIIGALNDVEKESTNSDEEFEKWENEVKALTPVIEESAESDVRETVSGVEETKRKSKRQIDRWGAKGPSEEDLIRAAAKAKEPMSACGGKDLLMEDRIYCRPPRRSANLISNRRKPGQVSKPITKSVTTIGENGVAYAKGEQGENGVKLTKGFDVPSLPARKRLRAAVMKPIPHTRHYRMLLFIPETNGLDASQVKPIPVVPVKHNVLLLAPTHRKSTLSSFHNQQIVPLNPLPMKKHGCDDCDRPPIQVCKEEEFLKDVMQFLTSRGHSRLVPVGGISEFPDAVLNAKRLDLYNLYREVVSRGGFYVGNGINWKGQVFSNMRNHTMTNRMTGVGNTLKRHYETYLLEYELAHDDVGGECCLLCHSSAPGDWVNCGVCGEWAHFGCDGRPRLGTFKEYAKTDGLEYICPHCSLANKRTQKTANGLCRASPAAPRVI